jgi:hypothetical protein
MIDIQIVRQLALALDEAEEKAHFEKQSFRIRKKIFAPFDMNDQDGGVEAFSRRPIYFHELRPHGRIPRTGRVGAN